MVAATHIVVFISKNLSDPCHLIILLFKCYSMRRPTYVLHLQPEKQTSHNWCLQIPNRAKCKTMSIENRSWTLVCLERVRVLCGKNIKISFILSITLNSLYKASRQWAYGAIESIWIVWTIFHIKTKSSENAEKNFFMESFLNFDIEATVFIPVVCPSNVNHIFLGYSLQLWLFITKVFSCNWICSILRKKQRNFPLILLII